MKRTKHGNVKTAGYDSKKGFHLMSLPKELADPHQ